MLDIIGILYLTLSTLYLLGSFPIQIFEFMDLRTGFAISDYALVFDVGSYFNISAIITGLLCGLDAITNPKYKRIKKWIYNLHTVAAFSMAGIGIFPLTGNAMDLNRLIHWVAAFTFFLIYPVARLLILKAYSKKNFFKIGAVFLVFNLLALATYIYVDLEYVAYPEYLMWLALMTSIILSQIIISGKKKG
jgi:hypothetical membrane protein